MKTILLLLFSYSFSHGQFTHTPTAEDIAMWDVVVQAALNKSYNGSGYQQAVSTIPAATLVSGQNTDGSWSHQTTHYNYVGPNAFEPWAGTAFYDPDMSLHNEVATATAFYDNNFRAYTYVVARAFYDGGSTDYSLFEAVMKNIQGIADLTDQGKWSGNKTSWTPTKNWGVQQYAYCIALVADGWSQWSTNVINGETVNDIMIRSLKHFVGITDNSWKPNSITVGELSMTGSADNFIGVNQVQAQASAMEIAATVNYVTGVDSAIHQSIHILQRDAFDLAWGKVYYDQIGEAQDWIGFYPQGEYTNHNTPGAQTQLTRYFYTMISTLYRVMVVLDASSQYDLFPQAYDNFMSTLESAKFDLFHRENMGFRSGRGFTTGNSISGGAFGVKLEDLATVFPTTYEDRILDIAYPLLGDNRNPDYDEVKYYWSTGSLMMVGGTDGKTNYHVGYRMGRGAYPNANGPAIAAVEQSAGDENYNVYGGAFINDGTGISPRVDDKDFSDMRMLAAGTGNWPIRGIDATFVPDTEVGLPTQSSTPNAENLNVVYSGCDMDGRYGQMSYYKDRLVWDPTVGYHSVFLQRGLSHPDFSDSIAFQWDLYSDIDLKGAVPGGAAITQNNVEYWADPITVDFGDGSAESTLLPGSGNPTSRSATNYAHWSAYDAGSTNPLGKGVIIFGTHNLKWDNTSNRYTVQVDMGTAPAGYNLYRVRVWNCTWNDVKQLRDNLATYFSLVNNQNVQGLTWIPDSRAQYAFHYSNQSVEFVPGMTLHADEPVSVILEPSGIDNWRIAYADGRYNDLDASTNLKGVNLHINNLPDTFFEFWKDDVSFDRSGGNGALVKPAGTYYGGGVVESILAGQAPPANPPANLAVNSVSTTTADVSWSTVGDADSYTVGLLTGGQLINTYSNLTQVAYAFTGLTPGTSYSFWVEAVNAYGSNRSQELAFTTDSLPNLPPDVPGNIVVDSVDTASVFISWDPVANADNYTIRLFQGGTHIITNSNIPATNTSFSNLTPDTEYRFWVRAINAFGKTTSSYVYFTTDSVTIDTMPPVAPGNIVVDSVDTANVYISWDPVINADNYTIRLFIGGTHIITNSNIPATNTSFSNLIANTEYRFWVRAVNAYGNSTSPFITFTTDAVGSGARLGRSLVGVVGTSVPMIKVYPNPTDGSGQVIVRLDPQQKDGQNFEPELRLYNVQGQIVWSQKLEAFSETKKLAISTKSLPSGLYSLDISDLKNGWHTVHKLLIMNN
ncbi:MAG: fibronectin type III domain-containing protein [Bacteroidia bacterium]|nr:fibronectin type III domain-containing protein [Bacteroidia bacterium]